MSVIEMLLRLACCLVGWMVVYAYCLWLATLSVVGCGTDGDEFWRLLFGVAPFVPGFAWLTGATAPLPSLHQLLRWGAAPLVVLVPLALAAAWATFTAVNLEGQGICTSPGAASWHLWWAPVQFGALGLVCACALRTWRLGHPTVPV